jgi:hypothetical protein
MKRVFLGLVITVSFLATTGQARSDSYLYTFAGGMPNNGAYTGTVATVFYVNSATTVDELGIYDPSGAALQSSHAAAIWIVGNMTPVATATIPSGTAGTLVTTTNGISQSSMWRFATLTTPSGGTYTLQQGTQYIIGAFYTWTGNSANSDPFLTYYDTTNGPAPTFGSNINTTSGFMPLETYYNGTSSSIMYPNVNFGGDSGYIGANFHVATQTPGPSTTPEPASVALACLGMFGLVGYAWRKCRRCIAPVATF